MLYNQQAQAELQACFCAALTPHRHPGLSTEHRGCPGSVTVPGSGQRGGGPGPSAVPERTASCSSPAAPCLAKGTLLKARLLKV